MKLAPCPILASREDRLWCEKPHDCFQCEYLQDWIEQSFPKDSTIWLCPDCAKDRTDVTLLGFYTEGECQNPSCIRDDGTEGARHSILLQVAQVKGEP